MEWLPQLAQLLRRPAVSWWDVVDIVLVSFLIYELLLLIRGTRAVQMALSAGFLIGLFFVSRWFDLETVNWVIRNLAPYVGFAIIVLFQADIRRALAHFGRAPFFKLSSGRRALTKASKISWLRHPRWRRVASARSSSSSARLACGTTLRAASRSTPRSPTTCSPRFSSPARRCTTAP